MSSHPTETPEFDKRPTVRIHIGMPEKGSVVALSDSAFRLMVEAICYCGREETNGTIPKALMARMASKRGAVKELVDRVHLRESDNETWFLIDYLRWNRSSAEIDSFRKARSESGSLGAHLRWHVPTRQVKDDCPHCLLGEVGHA